MRPYILGFALSVALTLAAPALVWWHEATQHMFPTHQDLRVAFILFALLQLVVQLVFFLHIGRGEGRQWNAVVLGFALFIVCVLVGGTFWIMQNLQYMGHTPEAPDIFMEENIPPGAL